MESKNRRMSAKQNETQTKVTEMRNNLFLVDNFYNICVYSVYVHR